MLRSGCTQEAIIVSALFLLLLAPVTSFQAQTTLRLPLSGFSGSSGRAARGNAIACAAAGSDDRLPRASVVRSAVLVAGAMMIPKPVSAAAEEEEEETEEDDSQIIDLEGINGKKLAVLGGALLFADVLSGLLTGRSIIPFPFAKQGGEDWKTQAVNKLLEDEKKKSAAKMGVKTTTDSPRVSSTGDMAKSDPFEIAKAKYAKKPSIDDLKRDLGKKLDTKGDDDDDDF